MLDFERSTTVSVSPDEAFRFLADPRNLPSYIATMVLAQPEDGGRMRVAADVEGRHEEGDAHFHTDQSQRRMEWGAEDGSRYRGWLQVSEASVGSSVTIHLHLGHEEDEAEINRVLDETIQNIDRLLGAS